MLLSNILKEMNVKAEFINEKEIDSFGLAVASVDKKLCTFIDSEKYIKDLSGSIVMVLTTKELVNKLDGYGLCIVDNPRVLFFEIHNFLQNNIQYCRPKFQTKIGFGCNISKLSSIAENNVIIGNNVIIEEFVVIRENTVIGDNSIIRAGVKVGGEGFEFKRNNDIVNPVKHLGGVKIGKNVEIQYNTCVDKAVYPWDDTVIGNNTKIDNLVHIAHAVKIGENVFVVALSGVGGRTEIGSDTWIGFSTTLSNGLTIGNSSRVNIGAVVTKSVGDGHSVTGNFAIDHKMFIRNLKKSVMDED